MTRKSIISASIVMAILIIAVTILANTLDGWRTYDNAVSAYAITVTTILTATLCTRDKRN